MLQQFPSVNRIFSCVFLCGLLCSCYEDPVYLEQNWTQENQLRELSYHTSQGSQLIPYQWFLLLEDAHSDALLRSAEAIERLRFLPDYFPDPEKNPDDLPIGFVKDSDSVTGDWLGINCAACHTGQIRYNDVAIRIDGAPSMGDYIGLLTAVRDSLQSTLESKKKFKRFSVSLRKAGDTIENAALREQMQHSVQEISAIIARNYSPEHVPGFGRVDAFASIRNEIFVDDLGEASNFQQPTAPVSFPFLWDTPQMERVQWAGNVENPYARNVGQVLGVLGRLNLQNMDQLFQSSVRRENVFLLEQWLSKLQAPVWPEEYLGAIDHAAATRGETLYRTADESGYSCESCHALKDASGQYPLTPKEENRFGVQYIKTHNIPLADIGTDPNTLMNIYDQTPVKAGALAPVLGVEETIGAVLLSQVTAATVGALFQQEPPLTQEQIAAYFGFRVYADGVEPAEHPIGYKARPLAGIWATAPYLHNGSVPTL